MGDDGQGALLSADFSRGAIAKQVLLNAVGGASVTVPVALGAVGGLAVAVLGAPWWVLLPALVGGAAFCKSYFIDRDKLTSIYIKQRLEAMRQATDAQGKALREELDRLGCTSGVEQFDQLPRHLEAVEKVLKMKFDPRGLAYMRYMGVLEQTKLTMLKELRAVAARLQSVAHIDADHADSATRPPRGAVHERSTNGEKAQKMKQQQAVEALLAKNQNVLQGLTELAGKLAEIDTDDRGELSADQLAGELLQLAQQAGRYDVNQRGELS